MEETKTQAIIYVPKFAKILMIVFIVIGSILVLLELLEGNMADLLPILIWLILMPISILRNLAKKTIRGYRTAGISACCVILISLSQFSTFSKLSLPGEGAFVAVLMLWLVAILSINKAFSKSFPGKKLLSKD